MHFLATRVRGLPGIAAGLAFLLLALTGCAPSRPLVAPPPEAASSPRVQADDAAVDAVEQRLRTQARAWRGVPYRWGGVTRRGVDCSGFVMVTYRDLFDLSLPRVTTEQVRTGQSVPPQQAQAGDLVFFRPPGKTRHVGIYLGRNEFAHASTSEGVTISRLDEPYWRDAYWTTRRILRDGQERAVDPVSSSRVEAPPAPSRRSGW